MADSYIVQDGHRVRMFDIGGGMYAPGIQLTGGITLNHSAVNVTTSSGQVLAANANRKYVLLINDSDTVIYLMVGAAAALNRGIRLNPNGGSYEMSAGLGNLDTRAINAIHGDTGNKVLLVAEGV